MRKCGNVMIEVRTLRLQAVQINLRLVTIVK